MPVPPSQKGPVSNLQSEVLFPVHAKLLSTSYGLPIQKMARVPTTRGSFHLLDPFRDVAAARMVEIRRADDLLQLRGTDNNSLPRTGCIVLRRCRCTQNTRTVN
jgi:hypothetical protein